MAPAVACTLISLVLLLAANRLQGGSRLTPDGVRYYRAGRGEHVPLPFRARWPLPRLFQRLADGVSPQRLRLADLLWRTPPDPVGRVWVIASFLANLGAAFACGLTLAELGLGTGPAVCAYLTAACLRWGLPYLAVRPVMLDSVGHLAGMIGVLALVRGDLPLLTAAMAIGLLSREMTLVPLVLLGVPRIGWTVLPAMAVCVALYALANRGHGGGGLLLTLSKIHQYALLHRSRWLNPVELAWHWLPLVTAAAVGAWRRPELLDLAAAFLGLGFLQALLGSDWGRLWYAAWPGLVAAAAGCPPAGLALSAVAAPLWPLLTLRVRPPGLGPRVDDGALDQARRDAWR